jgi:large subunit ribosomal protein L24
MSKIKRDDDVIVVTGKDKGKRGTVTRLMADGRVYVSGVNMIKKHTKGNPQMGQPGGIIEKEAPIQASNVAIYQQSRQGWFQDTGRWKEGASLQIYRRRNRLNGTSALLG